MKEYRGFYYEDCSIYGDVKDKVIAIFGDSIIKKAFYEITQHYGYNYEMKDETIEEFIDRKYNELISDLNNYDFTEKIDIDGISILIEFINGVFIEFNTSEWGYIKKSDIASNYKLNNL